MKTAAILSLLALIWPVAVLVKLASTRARGEPYRFALWDGGLMLQGQTIGRIGSIVLTVFCLACGSVAAYLFARTGHAL